MPDSIVSELDFMILGITGAFGCGKSSVLHYFRKISWYTFDADAVCRKFYDQRLPELTEAVRKNFGQKVFNADGEINRGELGRTVFRDPEKLAVLTGILYPLLTEELSVAIAECREKQCNGAFEIPLLHEHGFEKYFDRVLTVWVPPEISRQRLYVRNFDDEEITRRSAMQLPADKKMELADFAVINTGTVAELEAQLAELVKHIA